MGANPLPTEFAAAERDDADEVERQSRLFSEESLLQFFPDTVPDIILALNRQRQIVFANRRLYEFLGKDGGEQVIGRRVGEVLSCVHAFESEGGCGTTEFCKVCGAVEAMLKSQQGLVDSQECSIERRGDRDALDLKVWATPVELGGEPFTIYAVTDISHEKRRRALERIFFHDVLNTAGGLEGLAEMAGEADGLERDELLGILRGASHMLVEEIQSQRTLAAAESGELQADVEAVESAALLREVVEVCTGLPDAEGRELVIDPEAENVVMASDPVLLRRVVGNMTKNALEASRPGDRVTVGCRREDDQIAFSIHNPIFMPRKVQLQVFKRSFSTKGPGRGLGTYGAKLLTERYLGGRVSFTSVEGEGTTFYARYPLEVST
ncbi:PAS domain-containing sensor histidine kinase [Candidatus Latescibacterota bacterium]